MAATTYLAYDLGAESGRLMAGILKDNRLHMEQWHRFPTGPHTQGASLVWDFDDILKQIRQGLILAGQRNLSIQSLSADSWGLDYVLYDEDGQRMPPVYHYRDARTAEGLRRVESRISPETVFAETGIQRIPINTIYQLAAEDPQRLRRARRLLLIADACHEYLAGVARAEVSLASTTQLYHPGRRAWSLPLMRALNLPPKLLPEIVPSGTVLGPLKPEWREESGLGQLQVVAACSHDTAAAVAAVPAQTHRWAYISSGTWSLLGTELGKPNFSDACRELNFTNEIGYGNSVRLLKNISGLWLLQESRRQWGREGKDYDYPALLQMAEEAEPFAALIHPEDEAYVAPGDMPGRIREYCRKTGQPVPDAPGAVTRCILESLALLYRRTLRDLERVCGYSMERMHIVGGGSQNHLLNQWTADALELPVEAGPVEATAAGNLLIQALTAGHLSSVPELRQVVRRSFSIQNYQPKDSAHWLKAADRWTSLTGCRGTS